MRELMPGRDLDAELDSVLGSLRPRPRDGFDERVAAAIAAEARVRRRQRVRRAAWVGAMVAAAAAVLVVALPLRSPAPPPRWRVVGGGAGAPLAIGAPLADRTPLVLAPGVHVRLAAEPPSAAFVDLFDGAAATAIGADLYLLRGRARLVGRVAATTTWARVIATAPDARVDLTIDFTQEQPMFGKAGYLALAAATAGAALTITVVSGSAAVEPTGHGAPLVLAAGQRAVVPAAGAPTVATSAVARPALARTAAIAQPPLDVLAGEPAAEECPAPAPGTECEGDCDRCEDAEAMAPTERVVVTTDGAPSMGPASAAVTIVEFTDYQCPFCEHATATVHDLAALYPDDVRVVVKNLPLPGHKHARTAARAAIAAGRQGKYWEMHEMLFSNQDRLDAASLEKYARALGLDVPAWKAAFDDAAAADQVEQDFQESQRLGIRGTPTFVINGRVVVGALPLDALKKIVDDELARTKRK